MFRFLKTFEAAAGPHWLRMATVTGTGAYAIVTGVEAVLQAHGFTFFPTVPKVAFTASAIISLLMFWGWRHAHKLQVQNEPRIRAFLDPMDHGILTIPATDRNTLARVNSVWIQVSVEAATTAPLVDCEVRLIDMRRLNDDGTSESIVEEPVFCLWSQAHPGEERRMTIPEGVPQRVNLFLRDSLRIIPQATVSPEKIRLTEGLAPPGRFKVSLAFTAKDTRTIRRSYLFEWGVTLTATKIAEMVD